MTLRELSQLYYLRREIEQEQQRAQRLREIATKITASTDGRPSGRTADKTAIAADIADSEALIQAKISEMVIVCKRLNAYIDGIEDSLTRQIFRARFVEGKSWREVAKVCKPNTAENCRQICHRYLKK